MIRFGSLLFALSLSSASAAVVTVGDTDPPSDVGSADGWDAVFVFRTSLTAPNPTDTLGQVTQFEFWADALTGGREITPLLFSSTDGGANHIVSGIGTTYTVGAGIIEGAINTVPFALTLGTDSFDITTPGTTYYLGLHSTNNDTNPAQGGGVVPFAGAGGGPQVLWQTESIPGVGLNASTGNSATFSASRTYAYNFDINFVPEPSSFGLLSLAGLSLLFLRPRRRKS